MESVLITIHLMIVLALVGTVLLQRSEGGALGIGGGGGGGGGFMSGRGAGNALTRATAILAAGFFATSIGLTLLHRSGEGPSIFDGIGSQTEQPAGDQPLLRREQQQEQTDPPAPQAPPGPTGSQEPQVPQSQ